MTSSSSSPTQSFAPNLNQRGSSLGCSTKNAPSSPCGRPTRPTTTRPSVCNFDEDTLALAHGTRAHARPQRTDNRAAAPNHLADVIRRDVQEQDEGAVALLR